jgi:hypothetical protein
MGDQRPVHDFGRLANEVADLKSLGQRGLTREQINVWIKLLLGHLSPEDADRIVHRAALIVYQRRNRRWKKLIAAVNVVPLSFKRVREMFGDVLPGAHVRPRRQ